MRTTLMRAPLGRPATPPRRVRHAVLMSVLVVGALTGCGRSTPNAKDLTPAAALVLQRDAAALATAARSGNRTGVLAALAVLRRDVAAQQTAHGLSADRATLVLSAAAVVANDVPVPTRTATPAVPVSTPPAPARHGKDKPKGEDHSD